MEGRETTEGVAKVVQVRDDVEFERHWGGLGAVNWMWGLMQRWRGLENVSQVLGLLNNAINGHRTLQKEAWIWGIRKVKRKHKAKRGWPITKHLGGAESEVCESAKVAQSCLILQARVLEWVAFPFFRGSSQPRDFVFIKFFFFGCGPILKSSLNLLQCCFWFFFFGYGSCGSEPPNQGSNIYPLHWKTESYHWITKEVPKHIFNLDEYVEIMGVGIKAKGTFLFNSIIWNN